jgi:hypothetical protein
LPHNGLCQVRPRSRERIAGWEESWRQLEFHAVLHHRNAEPTPAAANAGQRHSGCWRTRRAAARGDRSLNIGRKMSSEGKCEHCGTGFVYELWHAGFSDIAYAYCDTCGRTATFHAWGGGVPPETLIRFHQPISRDAESEVERCECGGRFRGDASPRCPKCGQPLSPHKATAWIEANAPGTAKGWRWQHSWTGLYAICVAGRSARDPWKKAPYKSPLPTPPSVLPAAEPPVAPPAGAADR